VVGSSIGLEGLAPQWGVGTICEDDPVRFAEALARIAGDEGEWLAMSGALATVCRSHRNDPVEQWRAILAATVNASPVKETHAKDSPYNTHEVAVGLFDPTPRFSTSVAVLASSRRWRERWAAQ